MTVGSLLIVAIRCLHVLRLQGFQVCQAVLVVLKVDIHKFIFLFAVHLNNFFLELGSKNRNLAAVLLMLLLHSKLLLFLESFLLQMNLLDLVLLLVNVIQLDLCWVQLVGSARVQRVLVLVIAVVRSVAGRAIYYGWNTTLAFEGRNRSIVVLLKQLL